MTTASPAASASPTPPASAARTAPDASYFEPVSCYFCSGESRSPFVTAQEDLTGKPGDFTFVKCDDCSLVYQHPRILIEHIKSYYDQEYLAHRKQTNWGPLTPLVDYVMDGMDRKKDTIVKRHIHLNPRSEVLDIGCGVGTFLAKMTKLYGAKTTGVDFMDLSDAAGLKQVDFRCGAFRDQAFEPQQFDLITMWHYLEHDYQPLDTLRRAHEVMQDEGLLVIEVPRLDSRSWDLYRERWPGLQAPQHTVLFDKTMLLSFVEKAGFSLVEYLPYGAFPAYFYLFAGAAFKLLKGKGLNAQKAVYPYFAGQLALAPILLLEKKLNLAMQTVVCRKA